MQIWNHSLIFFPFFSPLCIAVLPPFILGRATHPLVNMSPTPPLAFFFGFTCSCSIFLLTRLTVARLPMPIHTELVFFFFYIIRTMRRNGPFVPGTKFCVSLQILESFEFLFAATRLPRLHAVNFVFARIITSDELSCQG